MRERFCKQRLSASGRPHEQYVRFFDEHVVVFAHAFRNRHALVVVVHGDGKRLFRFVLSDDILIEVFFEFFRSRDVVHRNRRDFSFFLVEHALADGDALIADVDIA